MKRAIYNGGAPISGRIGVQTAGSKLVLVNALEILAIRLALSVVSLSVGRGTFRRRVFVRIRIQVRATRG